MRTRSKLPSYASMFLLSLIGGLLTAYTYTVTLDRKFNLHALTMPAVFPIATIFGLIGGILAFPLLYVCLKGKNKTVAVPAIYAIVALVTACLNLIASPAGFLGAVGATCGVLLMWRKIGPDAKEETVHSIS